MWNRSPAQVQHEIDGTPLLKSLDAVQTTAEFKTWVRKELRAVLPHASFLASVGRLYAVGSLPTHRVAVEFPLSIIEDLKTAEGAINDPLAASWFKSGKIRQVDLRRATSPETRQLWTATFTQYGFRNILLHGVIDRKRLQFVTFHVANIMSVDSMVATKLIGDLADGMARTVCNAVTRRIAGESRATFWHPTITLTRTEIEIIGLIAQGHSNKEIARLREVSDSTIKTQISRVGAKIGATRRAEIVAIAMPLLGPLPAQTFTDLDSPGLGAYSE